jgi:hypothetical protein
VWWESDDYEEKGVKKVVLMPLALCDNLTPLSLLHNS